MKKSRNINKKRLNNGKKKVMRLSFLFFLIAIISIIVYDLERSNAGFIGRHVQEETEYIEIPDEDEEALALPQRTLDPHIVPYDGVQRSITCWGDSMTYGTGANYAVFVNDEGEEVNISGWTSPSTIEALTGIKTYNLGVAGETSYDIALRAGGIKMRVKDGFTVGYNEPVNVTILDEYDNEIFMADFSAYGYVELEEPDLVYIDKQLFKITGTEGEGLYIQRYSEEPVENDVYIVIKANEAVYTKASFERKDDILILEIGSNGGWNDYQELIRQYDAIIENSGCKYYIIVGDTDDPGTSLADTNQGELNEDGTRIGTGDTSWEATLREAYGEHFINMRAYLIKYGLKDVGLVPTKQERRMARNGLIPERLRSDWTHFNSFGYYSKGLAIYKKGVELGYWQ